MGDIHTLIDSLVDDDVVVHNRVVNDVVEGFRPASVKFRKKKKKRKFKNIVGKEETGVLSKYAARQLDYPKPNFELF